MVTSISQVFHDPSLYGHALTSLPEKVWGEAINGTPIFYKISDPGSAERVCLIFEKYVVTTERWPSGNAKSIFIGTNFLPLQYLEIGVRGIIGSLLATVLYLTVAPIGFALNTIQLIGMELAKALPTYRHIC